MNEVQYIGEHLWIHYLGHFLIVLSFVATILAALSYSMAVDVDRSGRSTWLAMGRWGFGTHAIATIVMAGSIFYAMYHHYYEYAYVFEHVSDDLPLKYVLSAFWEGQEGSFLLWIFWHLVLGCVIWYRGGIWEAPVMAVIAMVEVFLSSMLLGVYVDIGGWTERFGINPTVLLRDTMDAPIFQNADYLSLIQGNGLNPLLQNYWMTIHPPVTFLGFASTLIPFAYAIAGLWTKKYTEWLEPALSWALFSAGILGSGILMGSLWAYEALSFGGYWAWDPVENAVLVPWLLLVAGVHTHLIARSTGYSIKPTIILYILSFVLIVYSTYLTRSGVLGDTSVHAFTEMGLEKQLVAFQLFALGLGLYWFIKRYKAIPSKKSEESLYSREFWMFIGSLVLLFSGFLIIWSTSLPVFNTIATYFDPSYVGKVINDPVEHYNKYQMWIAVFISLLAGSALFFRYAERKGKDRIKTIAYRSILHLVIAGVLTFLFSRLYALPSWQYVLMTVTSLYAVVASLDYLITQVRFKLKNSAAAIAHFGFGLMILGVLSSGLSKQTISTNPFIFKGIFNEEDVMHYIQLIKGKPFFSQGYWLTYESDTLISNNRYYTIDFKRTEGDDQTVVDQFQLKPYVGYSNDLTKVVAFNPDTKHSLGEDLFCCVAQLAPTKMSVENAQKFEDTLSYVTHKMKIGDTLKTRDNSIVINALTFTPTHPEYLKEEHEFGVGIQGTASSPMRGDSLFEFEAAIGLKNNLLYKYQYDQPDLGIRIQPDEALLTKVLSKEQDLKYTSYTMKRGTNIQIGASTIRIQKLNPSPTHITYTPKKGDISVGAQMQIVSDNKTYDTEPIYIIRDSKPMGVKSYIPELGLHIKFVNINPRTEEFDFLIAQDAQLDMDGIALPVEIAENVPRSDYIILKADIYPGINMFWIGSTLIMLAFFLAMWYRYVGRKRTK